MKKAHFYKIILHMKVVSFETSGSLHEIMKENSKEIFKKMHRDQHQNHLQVCSSMDVYDKLYSIFGHNTFSHLEYLKYIDQISN